jgi:hypothetical protein
MKFKLLLTSAFAYFIFTAGAAAQDTSVYCQENGVLFTNCYEMMRVNPTDRYGSFTQRVSTNDGQVFYGWGTFKENKSNFLLTYSKANSYPQIKYENAPTYSDTLCIQWYTRDNAQEFFRIKYHDSTITRTYKADIETMKVKIPKSDLKDNKLELYQGGNKILDFTVNSTRTDFINIYAEDPRSKYLNKHTEKLTKTKFGFITKGVYTKGKVSNFFLAK